MLHDFAVAPPITGPSSYLPTIDLFAAHWASVNAVFIAPVPALILEGNRTISTLNGLRTQLAASRTDVEVKLNAVEFARADQAARRTALLGRAAQLADNVRTFWPSPYAAMLPDLPSASTQPSLIESALDDVSDIWLRLNGTPPPNGTTTPITLATKPTAAVPIPPPYTQANFSAELALLKTAQLTLKAAQIPLDNARSFRNGIQNQVRPILVDYRDGPGARLAPNHPLLDTIPRYSPLPGGTPEPANATGHWDVPLGLAVIEFTPSPSTTVARHELRYVPGPEYNADDESIAGSINVGSPSRFETLAGLPVAGVTGSYRVYAITAEGNERTSATVVIARP